MFEIQKTYNERCWGNDLSQLEPKYLELQDSNSFTQKAGDTVKATSVPPRLMPNSTVGIRKAYISEFDFQEEQDFTTQLESVSKLSKAEKLWGCILDEDEFLKMDGEAPILHFNNLW